MRKTVALLRYTTVLEAVKAGDLAVTEFLVEAGEAVNSRDVANVGLTPLHWAARKGRLQVAQLLLRNGASLNAKSDLGYTPLLEAAYNGHTDVCRLLLDNGAEVNTTNNYKNPPLHWAASKNHLATVELLVKRGANCEAKNKGGYTPLQLATGHGNTAVAKWLSDWCHRGPHSN
jgi:ankyrin repeat protein